jgi:hypothetical protein
MNLKTILRDSEKRYVVFLKFKTLGHTLFWSGGFFFTIMIVCVCFVRPPHSVGETESLWAMELFAAT